MDDIYLYLIYIHLMESPCQTVRLITNMHLLGKKTFASDAKNLRDIRHFVRECITDFFPKDEVNCIILAIDEACANIIKHAHCSCPNGKIFITVQKSDGHVVFELLDDARPIDKSCVKSRDLQDIRPGGLGVHIMHQIMDNVVFKKPPKGYGNLLELTKNIVS